MPRLSWNSSKRRTAEEDVADDQERPALADDLERPGDRAVLSFVVAFQHGSSVAPLSCVKQLYLLQSSR